MALRKRGHFKIALTPFPNRTLANYVFYGRLLMTVYCGVRYRYSVELVEQIWGKRRDRDGMPQFSPPSTS